MKFFYIYLLKLLKKISFVFGYELTIKKKKFTFLNIYKTYKEALTASKNNTTYVTKEFQKRFKLPTLDDIIVTDEFNILPLFCALSIDKSNNNDLRFLDVGGGHNPFFLYVLKSLGKKYKFQVLEEKNFDIEIPPQYKEYLKYVNRLEDVKFENLCAVIFGSSIQYIEDYKIVLNKIFENKIKYIFITKTFFTNKSENIITLQNNMENVKFPNIFFSFTELNNLFIDNNYKLIFQTKRMLGKYTHNVLDKKDFFIKDLLYKLDNKK